MKHSRPVIFAVIIIAAALALTLCGCGGASKEYSDPDVPIVVEEGQEFVIVLESNPTTGYQWQLAQPLDEEILSLVKAEFEEREEDGPLGAPGEERWTFKAEGRGTTTIDFSYVRPWEEEPGEALGEDAVESAETEVPEPAGEEEEAGSEEEEAEPEAEDDTEEPGEENGAIEIVAPEEAGDSTRRTFVVEVKKEGSKGEEAKEYDDPETEIEVELDFKFAIKLESSPSAGYSWRLAQPLDDSIVELVMTEYEREEKSEEAEGEDGEVKEGVETWTFEAVGEGDTEIQFEYVNTAEEDASPEEEKEFTVKVHKEEEEHITEE
jgi:inhibitor of cysteine peptidase